VKNRQYNRVQHCSDVATTTHRGGLAADCTKKSAIFPATAVSKPQNRYGQGRARNPFRQDFGQFIAKECGVRYIREEQVYDPKSAEKVLPTRHALTDSDIATHRANLRHDLASGNPERKSTTLEGIYHWLSEYKNLTPEERANAEAMAGRGSDMAGRDK
jgi:hypothetical protein